MTKFDKEYLELCKKILTEGVEVENRTGVNTLKIPSWNFEFDLEKEFPILQSKQTFFKNAIIEMLWIWQMQSNDIRELQKRGVHIWDEWMIDSDGIYRIYDNNKSEYDPDKEVVVLDPLSVGVANPNDKLSPKYDDNGNVMKTKGIIPGKNIVSAKYYGKEYAFTDGTAYGWVMDRYKLPQGLIKTIKKAPSDRRLVLSLWQNEFLRTAVLPSCVWSTEWDVTGERLNLSVHQRSCDVPLGLPFNVTQYATLLKMIAQVTDLVPGKINYSIKDAHIYVNQIDGINEQLGRYNTYNWMLSHSKGDIISRYNYLKLLLESHNCNMTDSEKKNINFEFNMLDMILNNEKPELWLNPEIKDFFMFDNSRELKDSKIKNYKHLGKLHFDIAQ